MMGDYVYWHQHQTLHSISRQFSNVTELHVKITASADDTIAQKPGDPNVFHYRSSKSSNMGFVTIKSDKPLKHSDIAEAVTDTVLASRDSLTDATQPIVKGKVQLLGKPGQYTSFF